MKQSLIAVLAFLAMVVPLSLVHAAARHEVFFAGTDQELDVYRIYGSENGPTLLVMGGIQGDEPGGYLAADLYADMQLRRGNLIVVPRANLYSILLNNRGPNGDMNRKFAKVPEYDPDSDVVKKIKELMREADCFLNMHDGSGFYHPEYIDDMRNPKRFGQSIIADTGRYVTSKGKVLDLEGIAGRVVSQVNASIHEDEYRFHFNNHRTAERDSIHKEQRNSATFYMLTELEKPAFASETSKSIRDFRKRVVFQTMVVNAFMKELGIEPDHPSVYIDPPMMEYALISINGANPVAVKDEQHLVVNRNDTIRVVDVKSNYKRGVVADICGYGHMNDTGKDFNIEASTEISVCKDMFPCGRIFVDVIPVKNRTWLILTVDQDCYAMEPEEVIAVTNGAVVELNDLVYKGTTDHGLVVNLKGFVSNWNDNTGEDRGCHIRTAELLPRYGNAVRPGVQRFRISAMRGDRAVVNFYIDIEKKRS